MILPFRSQSKHIKMCPLCNDCDYWQLDDICLYKKIAYLFDHPGTVFYAIFMSFWGKILLCSSDSYRNFKPFRGLCDCLLAAPALHRQGLFPLHANYPIWPPGLTRLIPSPGIPGSARALNLWARISMPRHGAFYIICTLFHSCTTTSLIFSDPL